MFKVIIQNENKEMITTVNNVTEIQLCKDGRHLIHYEDSPEPMIWQVPKGGTIISKWI